VPRFHGPQGRGALKRHREQLRLDAVARNAETAPKRRSKKRRQRAAPQEQEAS